MVNSKHSWTKLAIHHKHFLNVEQQPHRMECKHAFKHVKAELKDNSIIFHGFLISLQSSLEGMSLL